jgi:uncharacterized protein YlzI (FlbEa/FlbD family)
MLFLNKSEIMKKSADFAGMTFKQFIACNKIPLDEILVDKLFHNIKDDIPIYMDAAMIEYLGYNGDLEHQKKSMTAIIKKNFIEYSDKLYWNYANKDYSLYIETLTAENSAISKPLTAESSAIRIEDTQLTNYKDIYPVVPSGKNSSKIKHMLIMPKLFKEMLMLCNTEKGKQVRRYYLEMVGVMDLYINYQTAMDVAILKNNNATLISKMDALILNNKLEALRAEDRHNELMIKSSGLGGQLSTMKEQNFELIKSSKEMKDQLSTMKDQNFELIKLGKSSDKKHDKTLKNSSILKKNCVILRRRLDEMKEQGNVSLEKLTTSLEKITNMDGTITILKEQNTESLEKLTTSLEKITNMDRTITNMDGTITILKEQNTESLEKITNMDGTITNMDGTITILKEKNTKSLEKLTTSLEKITNMGGTINNMNGTITILKEQNIELKGTITKLDGKLTKMDGKMNNLKEQNIELMEDIGIVQATTNKLVHLVSPSTGSSPREFEDIVIYRFSNTIPGHPEPKYIIFKGQKSSEKVKLARITSHISKLRVAKLARPLTSAEVPTITQIKRIGYNGSIPNAKTVWRRFKRENIANLDFKLNSTTMFNILRITEEQFIAKLCDVDRIHREETV